MRPAKIGRLTEAILGGAASCTQRPPVERDRQTAREDERPMCPNTTSVGSTLESPYVVAHGSNVRTSHSGAAKAQSFVKYMTSPLATDSAIDESATVRCNRRLDRLRSASSDNFAPAHVNPASATNIDAACR